MKLTIFLVSSILIIVGVVAYVAILPQMSNPAMFKQNPSGPGVVVGDFTKDGQIERRTITETRLFYIIRGSQNRDTGTTIMTPDTTRLSFERRDGVVVTVIAIGMALAGAMAWFLKV